MVNKHGMLRRRDNAQNVSYTPYPTDEKHSLSTFVDQTYIQLTRRRKKTFFFQTSLPILFGMFEWKYKHCFFIINDSNISFDNTE